MASSRTKSLLPKKGVPWIVIVYTCLMPQTSVLAQNEVFIDGEFVISSKPLPNPPQSDPNRCGAVLFFEFDEVDGATWYQTVAANLIDPSTEKNGSFGGGYGPPFQDMYNFVDVHVAPAGRHRFAIIGYSSPLGCGDAEGNVSIGLASRFAGTNWKVKVTGPDEGPEARFTWVTSQTEELTFDFDASGSSDPDGTIETYEWNFGDGATGNGAATSHTYAEPGTYNVMLTVTDNDGFLDVEIKEIEIGPRVQFLDTSAFQTEDELYWPDSTYTLTWSSESIETVDIQASTRKNADPDADADWTISIAQNLDATLEAFDWTIPADLESPAVWLRIRDSNDSDFLDVSEKGRVRYGWQLYRVIEDESGELIYEAFDAEKHAWRDALTTEVFRGWIGDYLENIALKRDVVFSDLVGRTIEYGPTFDQLFWSYQFRLEGDEDGGLSTAAYVRLRALGAARNVILRRGGRPLGGTPSWRSFVHALGLSNIYGSDSPNTMTGIQVERAEVSLVNPEVAQYYYLTLRSGTGLCYGLAWSALAAFHDPEAFRMRYKELYPALTAVRELSTLPLIRETLDIIGSAFTQQFRSQGGNTTERTIPRLKAAFETDSGADDLVFADGGHAVLPYRIEKKGGDNHRVLVHDRTYPASDDGSFYSTAAGDEYVDYSGDSGGRYGTALELLEDFYQPGKLPAVQQELAIAPFTSIDVTVPSVGKMEGDGVIPIMPYRNDPDLPPIGYTMPNGPFEAALQILSDTTGAYFNVRTNDGTSYTYQREDAKTGEVDSIRYATPDGLTFVGVGRPKKVTMSMSSELAGMFSHNSLPDRLFGEITSVTVSEEGTLAWAWENPGTMAAGIKITNRTDEQDYSILLMRTGTEYSLFSATGVSIAAGDVHMLRADWSNLGTASLLIEVDQGGDGIVDATISVENEAIATGIPESVAQNGLAEGVRLVQNYPNPFHSETTIPLSLPAPGHVRLDVFDILGRLVSVVLDETMSAGRHEVVFDAARLPAGMYMYRLSVGDHSESKRMLLMH